MRKIGAICVASCLLVSVEAGAQTPAPARLNYAVCTSPKELKPGSGPLLRPDLQCDGEWLTPAAGLSAFQTPAAQKKSDEARRRRNGLIGLGVGAAAALLYGATVCRGSDSAGIVVAQCYLPIGGMIGAGFFLGRSVGQ